MNRYLYSNVLKIAFAFILACAFVPSMIYLLCSLLFDKFLNITSLISVFLSAIIWIILIVWINVLNSMAKNKIVFEKNKIKYNGRTIYKDDLTMRYFKFHISILEPSLVIPKLHINGNGLSVICYLSKKDIKKLEHLNYQIEKI